MARKVDLLVQGGGEDQGLAAAQEGLLANILGDDLLQEGIVRALPDAQGDAALEHLGAAAHGQGAHVGVDLVADTEGPALVDEARVQGDGGGEAARELELEGEVKLIWEDQLGVLWLEKKKMGKKEKGKERKKCERMNRKKRKGKRRERRIKEKEKGNGKE